MAAVRALLLFTLVVLSVVALSHQIENFEQTEDEEVPVFEECLDRGVFSVPCTEIQLFYQNSGRGSMCSNPYIKSFCCVSCQ